MWMGGLAVLSLLCLDERGQETAQGAARPYPAHTAQPQRPPPHPATQGDRDRHGTRRRHHHRRSRQSGRHLQPLCEPGEPVGVALALRTGAAGHAARTHRAVGLRLLRRGGAAMGRVAEAGV